MSVSVITPCYNGARFLAETLRSALEQTQPPHEIIVIDDGSTDDSAAIAESFGPPVRVIRQSNQGESVARNRGIEEARGRYLFFLDADDLIERTALEKLQAAVEMRGDAVACMGAAFFKENPAEPYHVRTLKIATFLPGILTGNRVPPHCWLVPTVLAREAGGFAGDIQLLEDWDFWCRIACLGAELVPVDHIGAYYRRHPNSQSMSTRMGEKAIATVRIQERNCARVLGQPDLLPVCAGPLFWGGASAVHRAARFGHPWEELAPLARHLERLIQTKPMRESKATLVRAARLLGIRTALRLWRTVGRAPAAVSSNPR